ncbi:hypothetical protein ATI61_112196 [Archangium gephyra]|uniref:Uncharacterized protein n=1 Tax=Archangium gephyra TaxID=48 RepID=A0AAC8Q4G3_9BACT|nr:hypothetical protein [Archangium gephyra]AKJ00935.1 Hypothetical protein AA314_02561 [Archangium gephyra]REG26101.1 hypothetical protein ATI61_112196 [Archangium gephyra]
MSGQAGAQLDSESYALFVGSGISVSYAPPPDDDGTAIGRWLEHARPTLDVFFARLAAEQRLPLVPLSEPSEEIHGVILEDLDPTRLDAGAEQHFRQYHRGRPAPRGGHPATGPQWVVTGLTAAE